MRNITLKFVFLLVTACFFAAFVATAPSKAASVPESNDPIKLAINEWTGQHITTHIAGEILKRMGYNVEYLIVSYLPQMDALMDNGVTATMEVWELTTLEAYNRVLDSGKVINLGDTGIISKEGWVYPAYVEERCPGLPDWSALENCADLFAVAETLPKGRIIDYPEEWTGENSLSDQWLEGLRLDGKFITVPAGSEGAMIAELKSAIVRKSPLLFFFWGPHWIHSAYDVKWVEMPPYEAKCGEDPSVGFYSDTLNDCGLSIGFVRKVAWKGIQDKWPAAYEFLKSYKITNDVQESLMIAVDVNGEDLEKVTKTWVDDNEEIWRPWVDAAMAGG